MNIFAVSFFGHRRIDDSLAVEEKLEKKIRELLIAKEYLEFLVGRNGEFDQIAASTIRRCKRAVRDDNSALILVLPYVTAEYSNHTSLFHEYYDGVEICIDSSQK